MSQESGLKRGKRLTEKDVSARVSQDLHTEALEGDHNESENDEASEGEVEERSGVEDRVTPYYFVAKSRPSVSISGMPKPLFGKHLAAPSGSADLRQRVLKRNLTQNCCIPLGSESTGRLRCKKPSSEEVGKVSHQVTKMRKLKKQFCSTMRGKQPHTRRAFGEVNGDVLPNPIRSPRMAAISAPRKHSAKLRRVMSCKCQSIRRNPAANKESEKHHGYFCEYLMEPPREGTLEITVTDNGCGISPEHQARLFQPFAQAHKGIHEQYGGTGLGLWLSQKLTLAMKGQISCESSVNKGTTFRVSLPGRCKTGKQALNVPPRLTRLSLEGGVPREHVFPQAAGAVPAVGARRAADAPGLAGLRTGAMSDHRGALLRAEGMGCECDPG